MTRRFKSSLSTSTAVPCDCTGIPHPSSEIIMGARCAASVFRPGKRWAATSVSTTVVVKLAPGSSVITSLSLQIRTGISTSMRLLPRII
ncbi:hypothetical protein ACS0TY_026331 [Phlomoides rotata]